MLVSVCCSILVLFLGRYTTFAFCSCADAPLFLSSLGTGTYLGKDDVKTDDAVTAALLFSVTHGWNVIDTGVIWLKSQLHSPLLWFLFPA